MADGKNISLHRGCGYWNRLKQRHNPFRLERLSPRPRQLPEIRLLNHLPGHKIICSRLNIISLCQPVPVCGSNPTNDHLSLLLPPIHRLFNLLPRDHGRQWHGPRLHLLVIQVLYYRHYRRRPRRVGVFGHFGDSYL